ncbi:unnamed protein product [Caenorhabditis brenneri]
MFHQQNNGVRPKRNRQPANLHQATENIRSQKKKYTELKKKPNYKNPCEFNKGKRKLQKRPRNEMCAIEEYRFPEKFKEEWKEIQAMPERRTRSGKQFGDVQPTTRLYGRTDPFIPLPEDAVDVIGTAWTPSPEPQKILFNINGYDIRNCDLRSLEEYQRLNDEVINAYMQLICKRNDQNERYPRVYAFNILFYKNLHEKGYGSVERWTKKIDIFSYGIVFIPIHFEGNHWILASINMNRKSIELYDSFYAQDGRILQNIRSYLSNESRNKKHQDLDFAEWEIAVVEDRPTQDNESDCGVFTCQYAEWISRGEPPAFTQANVSYYRRKMAYEIMKKKLLF